MSSLTSKIQIGYKDALKILKLSKLDYKENNIKKLGFKKSNFSKLFMEVSQGDDYKEIYDIARKNNDYDILIKDDDAIFQFNYVENRTHEIIEIRYAYYQAPTKVIKYEEFLDELDLDFTICGEDFYEDYEQFKNELPMKSFVTPIRYDYNICEYQYIKHPASHIHIGHNNEIRIPMSVIITPFEFVLFVLRHVYYLNWKTDIDESSYNKLYSQLRNGTTKISNEYFKDMDKMDFYFN